MFSFMLGKCLGVELLGHVVDTRLTFQETARLFQSGYAIFHPQSDYSILHLHTYLSHWLDIFLSSVGCKNISISSIFIMRIAPKFMPLVIVFLWIFSSAIPTANLLIIYFTSTFMRL